MCSRRNIRKVGSLTAQFQGVMKCSNVFGGTCINSFLEKQNRYIIRYLKKTVIYSFRKIVPNLSFEWSLGRCKDILSVYFCLPSLNCEIKGCMGYRNPMQANSTTTDHCCSPKLVSLEEEAVLSHCTRKSTVSKLDGKVISGPLHERECVCFPVLPDCLQWDTCKRERKGIQLR